ncbi:unnamed protein product [Lactuca virosa]|uniref:Protein kinase domain-containing protein n=1 Tax=Lactuca virosa TaxID=75947 RepID=A0AAU9PSD3_9ASTR|nr:unnamed protein product [Lactuca virosa]
MLPTPVSTVNSYLHTTCAPPLAHRKLKAANVLLDEDLTPRISDCYLTVLKPLTISSARALASETDTGGISYEHMKPGTGNQKDDVYAFGVLLLEILTGRKPFDGYVIQLQRYFAVEFCSDLGLFGISDLAISFSFSRLRI